MSPGEVSKVVVRVANMVFGQNWKMKNEEGEDDEDDEDKMESDDEEEIKPTEPMATGIQHLSKDLTYVFQVEDQLCYTYKMHRIWV